MSLDVVYGDEGLAVGYCECLGKVYSHEKRADKTGVSRDSHSVDIVHRYSGYRERLVRDRGYSLYVRS